ncbi:MULTISPECIES: hypothetical protein [unclassified Knoellia]|uniref:hypothetical protein n=1 Tax=Knoellia altitudinis TaxID=3404795 RepID=UPI00360D456A
MINPTETSIPPTELPTTIQKFLAAHAAREADAAVRSFTEDAVVVDQDERYAGSAQVLDFLQRAGSEFTYTTELVTARRIDASQWAVVNRIEGDFPGHVADLTYRFTLSGDLIRALTIR